MAYTYKKDLECNLSISRRILYRKVYTDIKMKRIILVLMFFCCLTPSFAAERMFPTLDKESVSYEKLISQKNTILFIWATWCPTCRRELEKLSRERIFFEGIDVWYINTGEAAPTIERYATAKKLSDGIRDRIILDTEGYIAQRFSVTAIPTYIFFKDGEPIFKSYFLNDEVLEKVFGKE